MAIVSKYPSLFDRLVSQEGFPVPGDFIEERRAFSDFLSKCQAVSEVLDGAPPTSSSYSDEFIATRGVVLVVGHSGLGRPRPVPYNSFDDTLGRTIGTKR